MSVVKTKIIHKKETLVLEKTTIAETE